MDPQRLGDWVTIHRRLDQRGRGHRRVGYEMGQQIHLRGVSVDVHWQLSSAARAPCGVGGPRAGALAGAAPNMPSHRPTAAPSLTTETSSTRRSGRSAPSSARALVGGIPEREALQNTLIAWQTLLRVPLDFLLLG